MKNSLVKKITIALVASSLITFQTFAGNGSTSKEGSQASKQDTQPSLGTWFTNFFSLDTFTPSGPANITAIQTFPTDNDVLITWAVSTLNTARVYYGTTTPIRIASGTPQVASSAFGNYANSKANIRHLTASTTYYFKIVTKETSGETAESREMSFITQQ